MKKINFFLPIILTFALVGCSSGQSAEQTVEKQEYDKQGYDEKGYDKQGFDKQGYDKQGFNKQGYDNKGYDNKGYDKEGFDENGYDYNGYNQNGLDRSGHSADYYEVEPTDISIDESAKIAYLDSVSYAENELQNIKDSEYATTAQYEKALYGPYKLWDNELNRIYSLLKDKLSTQDMEALRVEQRAWIKTRDQDSNPDLVGSLEEIERLNEYTKNRTLYLIDLYFD